MTLTEFKLCCNVNDIKNLFKSTNHVGKINVTDLSDKKRYLVLKTEIPFVNGQN